MGPRLGLLFLPALLACACAHPSASSGEGDSPDAPARLLLGSSPAQALGGGTSSFVLENTPDLALHASLRDAKYEGQTLVIRGMGPNGTLVWNYPHLQKGTTFDAVLPVFGSPAARKRITGTYSFEVIAPDRTVVAAGSASFRSTRGGGGGDGGAALLRMNSAESAVVAARGE